MEEQRRAIRWCKRGEGNTFIVPERWKERKRRDLAREELRRKKPECNCSGGMGREVSGERTRGQRMIKREKNEGRIRDYLTFKSPFRYIKKL